MNNKRKHKRTKVQCLSCNSLFDHDYCRKHELNIHGGSQVKLKNVSLDEANNPFAAARLNFERKVSKTNSDNLPLNTTCVNNTSPFNESVVSEISKGDLDYVPLNTTTTSVNNTSLFKESVVREVSKGDSDYVPLNTTTTCVNNGSPFKESIVSKVSKGDSDYVPLNTGTTCVNNGSPFKESVVSKVSKADSDNPISPIDISTSTIVQDSPAQPMINVFQSTNGRIFSAVWYTYNWIEYSITEDLVYCFA